MVEYESVVPDFHKAKVLSGSLIPPLKYKTAVRLVDNHAAEARVSEHNIEHGGGAASVHEGGDAPVPDGGGHAA